jgi:hypothetical protein
MPPCSGVDTGCARGLGNMTRRASGLTSLRCLDTRTREESVQGSVSKVEMDCDGCHTGPHFIVSLRKEWPMTFIAVRCPPCQSDQIIKRGKTARGTQRYLCQNTLSWLQALKRSVIADNGK